MSSEHDDHEVRPRGEDHESGRDDDVLVGGALGGHPRNGAPHRRRTTVALVAAAVLAAAGGGAYWAVTAGGGGKSPTAHAGPVTTLPGTADGGPGTVADTGIGSVYRLTGTLPKDIPGPSPLYRPDGGAGRAAVGRLAALLGVAGPVVADHGSWRAGAADGTGPALLAGPDAPGTWSYARNGQGVAGATTVVPPALPQVPPTAAAPSAGPNAADSNSTDSATVAPPAASAPGSAPAAGSGSGTGADAGTPPVSAQRAEAVAAPVLAELGLSGARVDATRTAGSIRTVTADPVVGGLPTHGWETGLDIDPNGRIVGGHGRLSALAKGNSYPVISADQAFRSLSARMMQPQYRKSCQEPMPDDKGQAQPARPGGNAAGSAASSTVPGQDRTLPTSLPCVAPHLPPTDITGAEFGLAPQFVPGGQALVPAWLFEARPEGSATTSVIARQAVTQDDLQGGQGGQGGGNAPGGPSPASPEKISGYQANGNTLTLTFWGGVCDTYAASASEQAGAVTVRVTGTAKNPGAFCPAMVKAQTTSVTLRSPLGTRTVVDATTDLPVRH
ncbi:hypothetical protein [Actinacidiphila paucisporea]|uniref:Large membrane protein n=1 Tax=Actinacidiphila paucisporea TaxID=310782 RepID=A0A1M7E555_9ACTN|nr:hypothetical protein [Actinacidiphila paucisporea]SHL86738.1 hypothetical protein SAMN05216499_106291 [Actinacidiphila paucisporea]